MSLEQRFGKLYKVKEVADYLGTSPNSIYSLARSGVIGQKVGGHWRFKEKDIEKLLNKSKNSNFIINTKKKNIDDIINKSNSIT